MPPLGIDGILSTHYTLHRAPLLIFAPVRAELGTTAVVESITCLEGVTGARVLPLGGDGRECWLPSKETMLVAGQELLLATRKGLT